METTAIMTPQFRLTLRMTALDEPDIRKEGIGRHIACDYMGAAEFEFGAVPCAFRLTRKVQNEIGYVIRLVRLAGFVTPVWIMYPLGMDQALIVEHLNKCADDERFDYRDHKESIKIKQALHKREGRKDRWDYLESFDIDTWCTVPYYTGHGKDPADFYPVWFSMYEDVLYRITKEASRKEPTRKGEPESKYTFDDVRLFDVLDYKYTENGAALSGRGMLSEIGNNLVVKDAHGNRRTIRISDVTKVSPPAKPVKR